MIMQLQILVALLGCLQTVICRDNNKPPKLLPAITNSLVNLGKMEIAFYVNGQPGTTPKPEEPQNSFFPIMSPNRNNVFNEPCPCSSLRNIKESFLRNPSVIINKILQNTDLFTDTYPKISTSCCDTTEHEDTVLFEIMPNQQKTSPTRPNLFPPLLFDSLIPNRQSSPIKSKAVEVFLYPKRKDLPAFQFPTIYPKKTTVTKDGIQIVGDKTLKSNLKLVDNPSITIKKDLKGSGKQEIFGNKGIVTNEVTEEVKEDITKTNKL